MELARDGNLGSIPSLQVSEFVDEGNDQDLPSEFGDDDALLSLDPSSSIVDKKSFSSFTGSSNSSKVSALPTSELRRRSKAVQREYQMDSKPNKQRLNFDFGDLIGREESVSTLKSCFDRMMKTQGGMNAGGESSQRRCEFVLISGESGVGKTRIARALTGNVSNFKTGIIVEGKCGMSASDQPYYGVARAFAKICGRVKETMESSFLKIQKALSTEFRVEAHLLLPLVPELGEFVMEVGTPLTELAGVADIDNSLEQLRYAFRTVTRVFNAECSPIILILDDLQWADVASLQVLDFLLTDAQNEKAIMIIGCYRTEDADENSILHNKMNALREKFPKSDFFMTEIEIKALLTREVASIISRVGLVSDPENISRLAQLCLKRTLGNAFFILEFLKTLESEGLVLYDDVKKKWSWDLDEIEDATMSTANVVVLLQERIRKLPQQLQVFLQFAAHLGSFFTDAAIALVWETYGRRVASFKAESVSTLLEEAVAGKFLEKSEQSKYRWVHDKVQEAAIYLTGPIKVSFQLDIGTTLYYCLDKEQLEDDLFNVVDLINNGNVMKRPEFAEVNLRAAEKAQRLSAFGAAARYASEGIELLEESKWERSRFLTVNLYCVGAEMAHVLGNVDLAEKYSSEVLTRSDVSTMESIRLRVLENKILATSELRFDDAIENCFRLLKDLGCNLSFNKYLLPAQALAKYMRTVKKAKKLPQSIVSAFELNDDPKEKAKTNVLARILHLSYNVGNTFLGVLCTCKLIEMTIEQRAINAYSSRSFATLAIVAIVLQKDYKTSEVFNNIALLLLHRSNGSYYCETMNTLFTYSACWMRPLTVCRDMLLNGYVEGMRRGDTEYAHWCVVSHTVFMPYVLGFPMGGILEECPKLKRQFEESAHSLHVLVLRIFMQTMTNLKDASCSDRSKLEGETFKQSTDIEKGAVHLATVHFATGELLLWNGDYEFLAERSIESGDFMAKLIPSFYLVPIEAFQRAVALYATALRTRKRKFKSAANKLRKAIAKLKEAGNPNVRYYDLFLTAEQLALDKKYNEARKAYNEAIECVTSSGHLQYSGLIHERYSDFLLHECKQQIESQAQLKLALGYYKQWGAVGKVQALEAKIK